MITINVEFTDDEFDRLDHLAMEVARFIDAMGDKYGLTMKSFAVQSPEPMTNLLQRPGYTWGGRITTYDSGNPVDSAGS